MESRYATSEALLEKVKNKIPLASQTFSKSFTQYPYGASPFFVASAKNATLIDVDGNQYTDFVNSLCAVTLGYQDSDVDAAVEKQMKAGVSFSLPHPIEYELAEKICDMVPSIEMVRYGKNGSDATSAAIRLARAYTGRNDIAICGYHGWHDWYISTTTMSRGIPDGVAQYSHTFKYNNLNTLQSIFDSCSKGVAAVIMEPMNYSFPSEGFLEGVRNLCDRYGAVLIFDEVITGFRFSNGGAQEVFGIKPDLTCLGKGLANGYPLSVVGGNRELMKLFEDVFFSFTFGGETLSLSAANAVMNKLQSQPVTEKLSELGIKLISGVKSLLSRYKLSDYLSIGGHPSWSIFSFKNTNDVDAMSIKTLWMQELLARGFLSIGTHNMSYAHSIDDVESLLSVYGEIFSFISNAIDEGSVSKYLRCKPLAPLFRVR